MSQFNLTNQNSIEQNYALGLLPQRNKKNLWYQETSCRSRLDNFSPSSENRRILNKTADFAYETFDQSSLPFTPALQKTIHSWIKNLGWEFPTSSVKTVFQNHIFNRFYFWYHPNGSLAAVSVCYFSPNISHIAYVFYDQQYSHEHLPIRLVLQTIIDSHQLGLKFCYLGRFSHYKRTMPSFEIFENGQWLDYNQFSTATS